MNNSLDKNYWSKRWREGSTGWDVGYPTPALTKYFDSLQNKEMKILIPGCGNAWEAEYLHNRGFKNVFIVDIAEEPLLAFHERAKDFPAEHLLHCDFFMLDGQYDLVVEQTFFCALDPSLRKKYVKKMAEIIRPGGKLAGLLFNCTFGKEGPPFGGSEAEYRSYFSRDFQILKMEESMDSIPPRSGNELFIELRRVL